MGLFDWFREAFPWLFEDVEDLVHKRLPFQDVKYDIGEDQTVFRFNSSTDAKMFELRGSLHGMKFDRTTEVVVTPTGKQRTWIVLTLRPLPTSAGRGPMRGPRRR